MRNCPASNPPTDFNPFAAALLVLLAFFMPTTTRAATAADEQTVAALDTEYQAAVEKNDAATMARILADDFTLVTGRGRAFTKSDLLESARRPGDSYEHQVEEAGTQKVRVHGDTAVVTALLWLKGVRDGKPFDYRLWFSDTYVRTPAGWKYFFGQASLPLPNETTK